MTASPSRPHSHAAFARARALIPGGVNSPARAFGGVGGEPIFFERAEGQWLTGHQLRRADRGGEPPG